MTDIERAAAMLDEAQRTAPPDEYERLGIMPETWTCVAELAAEEAAAFVFALATYGVAARVSLAPSPKLYHIAVQGGLKAQPAAWLASIRGVRGRDLPQCEVAADQQHPQAIREEAHRG